MHGKRRRLQRRTKKEWMCEVTEVEVDVVLEVVVEEDMVGVNGKENLMLDFECITVLHTHRI
jgi:hypothetical protein